MSSPVVRDGLLRNRCPVDLHALPPLAVSSPEEIRGAVDRARQAQAEWARVPFRHRLKLLRQAARRMLARRQEALELIYDEVGKGAAEGLMTEAIGPLQLLNDCARVAGPYLRTRKVPLPRLAFPGKRGRIDVLPRGVVGIIAPWNYPLAYFFKPVFPALLCGNAVVIKPSEFAPRTALWFTGILGEFLPAGLVSCVQGDRHAGQTLIESGIDALTFTGSFASGREVARAAAERMIPLSAELGGKDAAIVLADCELGRTVQGILQWGFHNAGQACGAIDRVFVEASVADRFVEELGRAAARLSVARAGQAGGDLGPLSHPAQLETVETLVADALVKGARLVCGGVRTGSGLGFQATVLDGCHEGMRIAQEPSFGPVIPVFRVADADEAVRRANDCAYGLCGSVWSRDLARAEALASRLEAGTVFVNNHAFTGGVAAAPWTGVKQSGYGIANSEFALAHYTRPRTRVVDKSRAPELYWFPITPTLEDLAHCLADAQLGKLGAIVRLPALMMRRKRELARGVAHTAPARRPARAKASAEGAVADATRPPLYAFERAWATAAFDAIFRAEPEDARRLPALAADEPETVLCDFYRSLPLFNRLGIRLMIWAVGIAPLFVGPRRRLFSALAPAERVEVLYRLGKSDSFLARQVTTVLKAIGAFSHLKTSRVQAITDRATSGAAPALRRQAPAALPTEPSSAPVVEV